MIQISTSALRDGTERARDVFLLNRLRTADAACAGLEATYEALGVDAEKREQLQEVLLDIAPIRGVPEIEAMTVGSMLAGVLIGLLIADSAFPAEELDLPVTPSR